MARHKKHPGKYRVRANRHKEAARHAHGRAKEGHETIAHGYNLLAGARGGHPKSRKKTRKKRDGRKGKRYGAAFGRSYRY